MNSIPGASRLSRLFIPLVLFILAACTIIPVTRPVVKIGLAGPFEGPYRYVGYDAIYALRLTLKEANAGGGVGGYTVEWVAHDDGGTVAGAQVAARALARDPQVVAVIGHFRAETTGAARAIYEQAGLPLIVAGTVEGTTDGRTGGASDLFCPLAEYLGKELEVRRLGRMALDFGDLAAAEPLTCAGRSLATVRVEEALPFDLDGLLLPSDPLAAGEVLNALRAAGWEGPVTGGPALGSPLFDRVVGQAAADMLLVSPYRWPEIQGRDAGFSAAYQALGPHVPRPGPFALTTYQAAQTLLATIDQVSRQGQAPTRQTLSAHLPPPAPPTLYLYRRVPEGSLQLLTTLK